MLYHRAAGRLDIVTGCMFSGKSTEALSLAYREVISKLNVLYINSIKDIRSSGGFSTHNPLIREELIKSEYFRITKLACLADAKLEGVDVVVVDECQFFDDLYDNVLNWVEKKHLHVIVSGLDGTFERKPFGQLPHLIPFCDEYHKLKARCVLCVEKGIRDQDALFSYKHTTNTEEHDVGGIDKYYPVCRACYLERTSKTEEPKQLKEEMKKKKEEEKDENRRAPFWVEVTDQSIGDPCYYVRVKSDKYHFSVEFWISPHETNTLLTDTDKLRVGQSVSEEFKIRLVNSTLKMTVRSPVGTVKNSFILDSAEIACFRSVLGQIKQLKSWEDD